MKHGRSNISLAIVKAMSLFGGVQVLNILCAIVRTKLVAVWIGPVGIGLFGLFNNAAEMIFSITSLGIRNSSVRDMAIAGKSGKRDLVNLTITVIKRWSWFVGLFGAVVTISAAPLLSRYTFGDTSRTWDFVLLSVVLLFNGITNGEQTILQGTSSLRRLAHASVWGVFFGLLISIPLFYYMREDSIVLSIVAYAVMLLLFTLLFRYKDYRPVRISTREVYRHGRDFARLGLFMTVSSFVTMLFSYVFSAYLNRTAGTEAMGLYQSGFTLINKYVGLIFTAIGMEYYPRLSSIHASRMRMHAYVSQEVNISMLVLLPIVCLFVLLREPIVLLLYSQEFSAVIPFVTWAIVGTIFRAYSWCMAYVILARGDGKVFLLTESASAVVGFGLNLVFFHFWGLTGLGVSYVVWYALYCVIVGIVYFGRYRLTLSHGATLLTVGAFGVSIVVMVLTVSGYEWTAWCVTVAAIIVCMRSLMRHLRR